MPEPNSGANINGPYDNPNIESFSDTIQTQVEAVAEMPTPPALQVPSSPEPAPNIDTTPPPPFEKPTQEPTGDVVLNATFADQNQTANVNAAPALDTYTVEKGDNLWKIGREQGLTNAEIPNFVQHMTILNSDKISDPDKIYPNQTFAMPSAEMLSVDASEYYKDKSASDIQQMRESALDTQSQRAGSGHSYLSDAKIAAAPSI